MLLVVLLLRTSSTVCTPWHSSLFAAFFALLYWLFLGAAPCQSAGICRIAFLIFTWLGTEAKPLEAYIHTYIPVQSNLSIGAINDNYYFVSAAKRDTSNGPLLPLHCTAFMECCLLANILFGSMAPTAQRSFIAWHISPLSATTIR